MMMRTHSTAVVFLLLVLGCSCGDPGSRSSDNPWKRADEIVRKIRLPDIPANEFRLAEFGGRGDGASDNREAFEAMIRACVEAGGGIMRVAAGEYFMEGPIHLESRMRLHLEEGARLIFSDDPAQYLPEVLTSWEGTRLYNYSPFIYARDVHDVAITGPGEIDGNASESWTQWKHLQDDDKWESRRMNNDAVPLEKRRFGEGHFLRPHLVQFYNCERVLVEDVKLSDAPFWCLHTVFSRHITVRGVQYEAFNYNNDGIDTESSEYVLIEDISFNNGDDNIAIKAGRDQEGRTLGRPSRNIVVRNCRFKGHNAIAVGSEMSGGVRDVYIEDCSFAGPVVYGFYLKGNRDRGGYVRDIYARNIRFDSTRSAIIIDSDYKSQGSCCPPRFSNIHVEGLRARHASDHGISLKGWQGMHLDSVFLSDVDIASAGKDLEASFVDILQLEEVRVNGKALEPEWSHAEAFRYRDELTGRELWQVTSDTAPAVACYFERQAFTADERFVVYASRRDGSWRLYRMQLATGLSAVVTPPGRRIMEDLYTVMPDGQRVCYLDGWKLYATHVETGHEEVLFDFEGLIPAPPLYTGSFTNDGRYTLVYVRGDKQDIDRTIIYRVDLQTGELLEMMNRPAVKITHPLLNPEDPDVISYVPGPDTQNDMSLPMEKRARSWKIDLETGTDRQFLTVPYGYRATHESWSFDGERFFFFRKTRPGWSPAAICSQDKQGGDCRLHYESTDIKLGHGTVSRDGRWFVSDSQEPGTNELVLVDLVSGEAEILCWPNSSVDGGHDARAHVHPSFSPKGNYVCFTSDRSGVSQVYVIPVSELTQSEPAQR
jgi:Tol biopolymer transport system component